MKKRSKRSVIRAYRKSGKMVAQTFHTGTNWGAGYRPKARECSVTGYIIEWYSDQCPCGRSFEEHPENESTEASCQ